MLNAWQRCCSEERSHDFFSIRRRPTSASRLSPLKGSKYQRSTYIGPKVITREPLLRLKYIIPYRFGHYLDPSVDLRTCCVGSMVRASEVGGGP